jgi:small nuclear ribonucleoprotein (snRNP)-like protein/putative salt-induced outer membrane protein YdiY
MRLLNVVAAAVLPASCLMADQVTLKNGDRLTGSIVMKDEKVLVIKSEILGEVSMPWEQVDSIRADEPVNVVLSDGRTVQGTLNSKDEQVAIQASGELLQVSLQEITTLRDSEGQRDYERLLNPGWGQLWAGAASLGFAGTQGNAKTRTLTAAVNAARVTNADKTTLYFSAIRASALLQGILAETAQAVRGGWGYNRNVSSRLFVNGFNDYEYDRFQNLDLRFVLGGGLGYMAWKGERGRLDVLAGGAYNRESFAAGAETPELVRNSGEAYVGDDFTYNLNSVTSLYQNMRMFPNLSETGEYRLNFDLGANTKLLKWLVWNVALSSRVLSNPVPGRQKNDLLYTTGIGVTFAR